MCVIKEERGRKKQNKQINKQTKGGNTIFRPYYVSGLNCHIMKPCTSVQPRTVELHLSELIWTMRHSDLQKNPDNSIFLRK